MVKLPSSLPSKVLPLAVTLRSGCEPGQADLMAVRDVDQAGRVGRRSEGVLGEGHARATETLGLDAITVVEVTIGSQSRRGSKQEGERELDTHVL